MERHIIIQDITPCLDNGLYPLKRLAGESLGVEATVFRDGHDRIRVVLRWKAADEKDWREAPMQCVNPGLDRWMGGFLLEQNSRYAFQIEAWTDRFASWIADFRKRVDAGVPDLEGEWTEGLRRLTPRAATASGADAKRISQGVRLIERRDAEALLAEPFCTQLQESAAKTDERQDAVRSPESQVMADRTRAVYGAWYELFVRSQSPVPGRHGTFRDASRRLEDIRGMGFDVVYLAPIHPIGRTGRKGPNNSPACKPGDPGSPWAIGGPEGGHDAVHPELGTLEDFDAFVTAAGKLGMEVALDLALQCSPDHPWVAAHPDWFFRRPDGSIQYAENPPKKYEDIYPLDFDSTDRKALWEEVRRIVLFWAGHGVRIFRVDNPHTKPVAFWEWLIRSVQEEYPDVLFLAEAFTRPPMMLTLAKAGFTQSYTYFTWRNTKAELSQYMRELRSGAAAEALRPNFFANTPDINPYFLQAGGRPAFALRLVLAATLTPSYGIYSGFELCENAALPGREEYLDSEKYELKCRDWDEPGNIRALVRRVNSIRRSNPALQRPEGIFFLDSDNDGVLAYVRHTLDRSNILLVIVNLDPSNVRESMVSIHPPSLGLAEGSRLRVHDLLSGETYVWGNRNYVKLDPAKTPAHILKLERTI
ncbi:MAG: maltotransferase domain-containing protein [Elusimicrobiota bacterium]